MYSVRMDGIRFEWDAAKAKANLRKHGISLEEARTVFYDEQAVQYFDPDHSVAEDRFILLGMSFKLRVIVVCHCYRESESVIRLFTARKAEKDEAQEYWRQRR